ncbi:MAG: type II secretion system protein [Patescibacteria group bacterium]
MVKLVKLMTPNLRPLHQAKRFIKRSDSAISSFRGGFTLVELLVVVAIIAMLGSIIFVQFSAARSKARDAEREQEIKTLQSALGLYVNSNESYPSAATAVCLNGSDAVSTALISGETLSGVPFDPQHNCPADPSSTMPSASFRYYRYVSTDTTTYTINYYLETDTIPGKSAGLQTATP